MKINKEQTFSVKELHTLAISENIMINDFTSFISKMNEEGILLKTSKNTYKFIT